VKDNFLLIRLTLVLFLSAINLSACRIDLAQLTPRVNSEGTPTHAPDPFGTGIAGTPQVSFQSSPTRNPGGPSTTLQAAFTITPSLSTLAPDTPSPSPTTSLTPTPFCDRAAPGNPIDITIPDDTPMQPGQYFTKTWRLINAGGCAWTKDYAIVFFSGKIFGAPKASFLNKRVDPNTPIDLSLDMVSPMKPGVYQSNWKLSNARNTLFGIGPDGNSPFWVRILVEEANTTTPQPTTPTPIPTAAVINSGVATLKLDDALNLETNQVVKLPADLLFSLDPAQQHQFTPQGGARLSIYGKNEPASQICLSTALGADAVILEPVSSGSFFCYRTRQGLPGWLRLVALDLVDHTVSVEFLTWNIP
jgi:hypothetical protein